MSYMGALKDLWKSERGLIMVALIAAVTVLCGLGYVTEAQWLDYTKWIFVTYVAGKTVTGGIALATTTDGPAWPDKLAALADLVKTMSGAAQTPPPVIVPAPTAAQPPPPPPTAVSQPPPTVGAGAQPGATPL